MRRLILPAAIGALLLTGVVLFIGRSPHEPQPGGSLPAAGVQGEGAHGPGANAATRRARVDDRLDRLRTEYDRRRVTAAQRRASKRPAPEASGGAGSPPGAPASASDELDPDERAALQALRHTLVNDPDPDERIGAALMLSADEGPASMRVLMEAVGDPDPEVRLAVVEALGDRAEELTPSALMQPLADQDPEVRFEAVSILGDMEDPEALQLVKGALEDPDDDVRALAAGILDFSDDTQEGASHAK
ncbi:MAG: HEAT repeat domain-containing protein [Candidatus Binatia bacterium]